MPKHRTALWIYLHAAKCTTLGPGCSQQHMPGSGATQGAGLCHGHAKQHPGHATSSLHRVKISLGQLACSRSRHPQEVHCCRDSGGPGEEKGGLRSQRGALGGCWGGLVGHPPGVGWGDPPGGMLTWEPGLGSWAPCVERSLQRSCWEPRLPAHTKQAMMWLDWIWGAGSGLGVYRTRGAAAPSKHTLLSLRG